MDVIVETKVTNIGEMVEQLLQEQALILFDETAPKELHEVAVLHADKKIYGEIMPGDLLMIDDHAFEIYFVGEKANRSMEELGHVTFKFDGSHEDMPGSICIEPKPMPKIAVGSSIQIVRNETRKLAK